MCHHQNIGQYGVRRIPWQLSHLILFPQKRLILSAVSLSVKYSSLISVSIIFTKYIDFQNRAIVSITNAGFLDCQQHYYQQHLPLQLCVPSVRFSLKFITYLPGIPSINREASSKFFSRQQ